VGSYFRAVAIDYDGTLSQGRGPGRDALEAVDRARQAGLRLILVTGRILAELRHEFPDAADHFDAIVAENGAVLHRDGVTRLLTAPLSAALDAGLLRRGIPFRRGQVLLACDGEHDVAVVEELRRVGLDGVLSRNRDQLMVLPPGITKGSGVAEALAQLGVSRHSALAIGDAENDQALLEACEVGVAVANAVASLKEHADVVLGQADGSAVARFLDGPLLRDELLVEPKRWQVDLGRARDGHPVTLPGSRCNVLVTGGSGSGKSYAAGFFAERLVALGYSVCVFDPEGDHAPLGRLHKVVVVGGREALPPPAQLARIVQQGLGSVVVDLSFAGAEREAYVLEALGELEKLRSDTGVPHWIFIDEAHVPLGVDGLARRCFDPLGKGFCLVTYRPMDLCEGARGSFDFLLALPGEQGFEPEIRASVAGAAGIPGEALEPALTGMGLGQAVLLRLDAPVELRVFSLAPRWLVHVRHWHKYAASRLPSERCFYFRTPSGASGAVAANLAEFHHELRRCAEPVLRHHAAGSDFSRWIQEVIQDSTLAASAASVERRLAGAAAPDLEALRGELLHAIESRYLA
jgi:hydroxymethylpyrimidine pyrophosphatase-like HAD family hydrolase